MGFSEAGSFGTLTDPGPTPPVVQTPIDSLDEVVISEKAYSRGVSHGRSLGAESAANEVIRAVGLESDMALLALEIILREWGARNCSASSGYFSYGTQVFKLSDNGKVSRAFACATDSDADIAALRLSPPSDNPMSVDGPSGTRMVGIGVDPGMEAAGVELRQCAHCWSSFATEGEEGGCGKPQCECGDCYGDWFCSEECSTSESLRYL